MQATPITMLTDFGIRMDLSGYERSSPEHQSPCQAYRYFTMICHHSPSVRVHFKMNGRSDIFSGDGSSVWLIPALEPAAGCSRSKRRSLLCRTGQWLAHTDL